MSKEGSRHDTESARDLSLGRFMDAWSRLEASIRELLSALSHAPPAASFAIAAAIPDLRRMRELLLALGELHLPHDAAAKGELKDICRYLQICGDYRNAIVHGQWISALGEEPGTREWVRLYVHPDKSKEMGAALGTDSKAKAAYAFNVARLDERSQKTLKLSERVREFTISISRQAEDGD